MNDPQAGFSSITSPAGRWVAITPSDTVPLAEVPKALWANVAGDINLRGTDANAEIFTVVAGLPISLRPTYVLSTGTTATGIRALFS